MDTSSDTIDIQKGSRLPQLQSILVNHVDLDDDTFFNTAMRPRANTDPISPRPCLHVRFDLPDIVVDDCSDNDADNLDQSHPEEINRELVNTDEGAFFVFKSPPRQRSNTCPINMFSKHKARREIKDRPPTPPPLDKIPLDTFPRYPSWEKVHFCPHSLSRVEEARETTCTTTRERTISSAKSDSSTRTRKTHTRTNHSSTVKELNSSPKRTVPRIPNGHVSSRSSDIRDAIHTSA